MEKIKEIKENILIIKVLQSLGKINKENIIEFIEGKEFCKIYEEFKDSKFFTKQKIEVDKREQLELVEQLFFELIDFIGEYKIDTEAITEIKKGYYEVVKELENGKVRGKNIDR